MRFRPFVLADIPLCAAAVLAGAVAHAQTIPDHSFESPSVGSGVSYDPSIVGVTFAGEAGVQGNGSSLDFTPAPDGTQTAFLTSNNGGNSSVTLDVTGLTPGTYTAGFYLEASTVYSPVDGLVTWNEGTVETFSYGTPGYWLPAPTFPFVVGTTSGQFEIQTAFVSPTGFSELGIDDVTFTRTGPVPEPAAWALMLVGFGGLGAMLRRGRTAVNA